MRILSAWKTRSAVHRITATAFADSPMELFYDENDLPNAAKPKGAVDLSAVPFRFAGAGWPSIYERVALLLFGLCGVDGGRR